MLNVATATGGDSVKSARRALEILDLLTSLGRPLTFAEIARELGYPRSSLHGLLRTLVESGWAELDEATRRYTLGIRAWEAGNAYLRAVDLAERARPFMERVRDALDETVQLTVLDGTQNVYVARVSGSHRLGANYEVGGRVDAHASAGGKALLAYLDPLELRRRLPARRLARHTPKTIVERARLERELEQIRARGYSLDDEEYTVGVRCVAVPVRDHEGQAAAAMSVSVPIVRLGAAEERMALALLRAEATGLSMALGYRPPR
jgi:DNA-binding IclR family transcriptional regulator